MYIIYRFTGTFLKLEVGQQNFALISILYKGWTLDLNSQAETAKSSCVYINRLTYIYIYPQDCMDERTTTASITYIMYTYHRV